MIRNGIKNILEQIPQFENNDNERKEDEKGD